MVQSTSVIIWACTLHLLRCFIWWSLVRLVHKHYTRPTTLFKLFKIFLNVSKENLGNHSWCVKIVLKTVILKTWWLKIFFLWIGKKHTIEFSTMNECVRKQFQKLFARTKIYFYIIYKKNVSYSLCKRTKYKTRSHNVPTPEYSWSWDSEDATTPWMTRIPNVSIIQNTTRALPCAYAASFSYSLVVIVVILPSSSSSSIATAPSRPTPSLLLFTKRGHGRGAPPPTGRVSGAHSSTFTGVKRRTHKSRPSP